jgi:hypothetical protein
VTLIQHICSHLRRGLPLAALWAGLAVVGSGLDNQALAQYVGGEPPARLSKERADRTLVYRGDHEESSDQDKYGDSGIDYGWFYDFDTEGWHDGDRFESDNYFVVPGRGMGRHDEFYDAGDDGAPAPAGARVTVRDVDSIDRRPAAVGVRRSDVRRVPAPAVVAPAPAVVAPAPATVVRPRTEVRVQPRVDTAVRPRLETTVRPRVQTTVRPRADVTVPPRVQTTVRPRAVVTDRVDVATNPGVIPNTPVEGHGSVAATNRVADVNVEVVPGSAQPRAGIESRTRSGVSVRALGSADVEKSQARANVSGGVMIDNDESLDAEAADEDYDIALFAEDPGEDIDDGLTQEHGRVDDEVMNYGRGPARAVARRHVAGRRGGDGRPAQAVRAQAPVPGLIDMAQPAFEEVGTERSDRGRPSGIGGRSPSRADIRRGAAEDPQGQVRHEGLAQRATRRRAPAVLHAGVAGRQAGTSRATGQRTSWSSASAADRECLPRASPTAGTSRSTSTSPASTTRSS